MKLVSGIVDSGFFAQSALSAEVATKDSLGRNISETYLTGVDLTPYQTVEGMTAYQPVGSYLTTGDSANFYTTANESGFISEVPAGTMNESAFGYDENDKISGYNGSAFAGGSDVPEGVMVESGLEYNAVQEISGYNGSAIAQYGAEKQWLVHDDTLVHAANSAQYALGVNISAIAQLLGVDETVLWSGSVYTTSDSIHLSESPISFNKIRTITIPDRGTEGQRPAQINDFDMGWNTQADANLFAQWQTYVIGGNTYSAETWYLSGLNGSQDFKLIAGTKQVNSTVSTGVTSYQGTLKQVIGIGRKA